MKKLTEIEQKMLDWDNELRFYYSTEYSDKKVIEVAQKAIDFAYANFKKRETIFEGFSFQYEGTLKILLRELMHICKKIQIIKNRN